MNHGKMGIASQLWAAGLLTFVWGCSTPEPSTTPDDQASPTDDGAQEDRNGCPVLDPGGEETVVLLKGPYLQAPVANGMTVAFETDLEVPGLVVLYDDLEACPIDVVSTSPTKMSTFYENLQVQMDDTPGWQHVAKLEGLEPGHRYSYRVLSGASQSDLRSFRATPERGQPFTAVISGDNRTHDADHQRVVDDMLLHAPDLVVNTGDMMTSAGMLSDWEGFLAIEHELISEAPLLPCFGNHEAVLGDAYYAGYFHVAEPRTDEIKNYVTIYGDAFWITLDSTLPLEDEEVEWLTEQLERASSYPYLFVSFHHPFYSFSKHVPDTDERERLHPLFVEHGVSAVWNGHNHCYERFVVDGIQYVVTGGGGSTLYGTDSHVVPSEEPLRVKARSTHHYVLLTVDESVADVVVIDVDAGEDLDTFTLLPREAP